MIDLRALPSVDELATLISADPIAKGLPQVLVVEIARSSIDAARAASISAPTEPVIDPIEPARQEIRRLARLRGHPVINATGVLLHTNLGRAPLHPQAADSARSAAVGYSNLEFDLNIGNRGSRGAYLTELLAHLTGAPAAMVVNNNAAALFAVLHTLATGRQVPVSRGELIEIGGSYRLPELMNAAGVNLVEVGTTNRTRVSDFRRVLGPDTALLLKVHPSNYRVVGFTQTATIEDLVELAAQHGLPVAYDVGSGLLDESVPWIPGPPPAWLEGEPGVRQTLRLGVDLVMFSGDKLFGGCQAGIIVGRADLIDALKTNPLARALRVDGLTLAALSYTAELYAAGQAMQIPFWRMVTEPCDQLEDRLRQVASASGVKTDIQRSEAMAGAGSLPGMSVESPVLVIPGRGEQLWADLLQCQPVVVARRRAGDLLIDLRAVSPADDHLVATALQAVCRS